MPASILLTRHNPESREFLRNSQYTSHLLISIKLIEYKAIVL